EGSGMAGSLHPVTDEEDRLYGRQPGVPSAVPRGARPTCGRAAAGAGSDVIDQCERGRARQPGRRPERAVGQLGSRGGRHPDRSDHPDELRGRVTPRNNIDHRARSRKEGFMGQEYRALSREELEQLAGEALPERAAMSLINANLAVPINAAIAANV